MKYWFVFSKIDLCILPRFIKRQGKLDWKLSFKVIKPGFLARHYMLSLSWILFAMSFTSMLISFWCPRYQISFFLENRNLIFWILKRWLHWTSTFKNYLILLVDLDGVRFESKSLALSFFFVFSLLFKKKRALIAISILSINSNL